MIGCDWGSWGWGAKVGDMSWYCSSQEGHWEILEVRKIFRCLLPLSRWYDMPREICTGQICGVGGSACLIVCRKPESISISAMKLITDPLSHPSLYPSSHHSGIPAHQLLQTILLQLLPHAIKSVSSWQPRFSVLWYPTGWWGHTTGLSVCRRDAWRRMLWGLICFGDK